MSFKKLFKLLLVFLVTMSGMKAHAVYDTPTVNDEFNVAHKIHLMAHLGIVSIDLDGVGFSETGIKPNIHFFPSKNFALNIGYFTVVSTDGSSNFNGFDFGFRYYLFGAGTSLRSRSQGLTLTSHPKWTYYLGAAWFIRELRFNTANLTFSGFGFSAGTEYHISKAYFLGFEIGMASLKNALGSSRVQNMTLTRVAFSIGTMF